MPAFSPYKILLAALAFGFLFVLPAAAADIGNTTGYAWGEKTGWIRFDGADSAIDYGITVGDASLSGYAWSEKLGWINFNDAGSVYSVKNDGTGNLSGQAWGEKAGWVSAKDSTAGLYQVAIDGATGVFSGYAWGEKTGWINFNNQGGIYGVATTWRASGAPPVEPPPDEGGGPPGGGGPSNCNFHNINGFAWSYTMGWISLSCQNTTADIDYGLDINFDSGPTADMTGYGWSPNAGWVDFQPAGPYPTAPSHGALFTRNDPNATSTAGVITGWAKVVVLGSDGWIKLGPLDIEGTDYGLQISDNRAFSGWAWNGGDNIDADPEPERGLGWISWRGQDYGAGAVARWFETLYGDIYSGNNIDQPFSPPAGRYSATYLIQANGAITPGTIISQAGSGAPFIDDAFGVIALPQESNAYRSTLGLLDRTGIINGYYGIVTNYAGGSNSSGTLGTSLVLNNRLYRFNGNLTIDSDLVFNKGVGAQKGSGTILVDGDLIINANMDYEAGALGGRIDNLPSVAWLVKGNIIINPSVTNIVGLFYSEGAAGITTGTTGDPLADVALSVKGLMVAKKITLQRLFVAADNSPSEQITFDGRAIVNPPPGLADMAKGLPALREVSP